MIAGPTAGGKTALAVAVAELFGRDAASPLAEVVSADSMLLYRGLDIGSAKPTPAERRGIPHHLIDVAEPTDRFTVHDWLAGAEAAIADLRSRGGVPVVVGGTHLYLKALLDGLFDGPGEDPALRERLRALPPAERRAELERIDPEAARRIHANDERRTVRALEVHRLTGTSITSHQRQWDAPSPRHADRVLIGLEWPSELLNPRINARVRRMFDLGLLEEARALWSAGRLGPQAREALGYKQLIEHFEGRCTLDDAIERIKIETRRFAKNQRTWLRRLRTVPGSVWIDAAATPADRWPAIVAEACRHPASPTPTSPGAGLGEAPFPPTPA